MLLVPSDGGVEVDIVGYDALTLSMTEQMMTTSPTLASIPVSAMGEVVEIPEA